MKNHACQLKKKGNEREIKKLKIISWYQMYEKSPNNSVCLGSWLLLVVPGKFLEWDLAFLVPLIFFYLPFWLCLVFPV
jgi:hypothetical protein